MPRNRMNYGIRLGLFCLCRQNNSHDNANWSFKRVSLGQWIVFVCIVILLQYHYYSAYYSSCNISKHKCGVQNAKTDYVRSFQFVKHFNYHRRLMTYQRFLAMNYDRNDLGKAERPSYKKNTPICFLNLTTLGPRTVNKTKLSLMEVQSKLPQVLSGGFYAPKHCRPRHKVAILIPYRDRLTNLVIFLYHMHPLWQKQMLEYRVFVVEQYGHFKFNKGALYNIAFIEIQRFGSWDCLFFHDVDLIPLDERVLYTCPRTPTHMSPAVESNNFKLQYNTLFGGVTAMTPKHFLKVNGYSNYYWNWGAEDDDMYNRLKASRLTILRLNSTIARFATLPHKPQEPNPDRFWLLKMSLKSLKPEGLSTLEYKLHSITKKELYTHILVDVNPPKIQILIDIESWLKQGRDFAQKDSRL